MVDLLTTLGGISWDLEVRGILVVAVGTVYNVVALVDVKSAFLFTKEFAIMLRKN